MTERTGGRRFSSWRTTKARASSSAIFAVTGFVWWRPRPAEAMRAWEARRPDAVLLDLGLPDRDGLDVIEALPEGEPSRLSCSPRDARRPRSRPSNAVQTTTSPSRSARRSSTPAFARSCGDWEGRQRARAASIRNGSLAIDTAAHEVRVDDEVVGLVPREFQILAELMAHPGRLVTRGRLLRAVWGEAYSGEDHCIHVYVEPDS